MKKQNTNYINEQGKKGKPDQIGGSMGNWCFPMFQTGFRLVSDPSQVSVVNFWKRKKERKTKKVEETMKKNGQAGWNFTFITCFCSLCLVEFLFFSFFFPYLFLFLNFKSRCFYFFCFFHFFSVVCFLSRLAIPFTRVSSPGLNQWPPLLFHCLFSPSGWTAEMQKLTSSEVNGQKWKQLFRLFREVWVLRNGISMYFIFWGGGII